MKWLLGASLLLVAGGAWADSWRCQGSWLKGLESQRKSDLMVRYDPKTSEVTFQDVGVSYKGTLAASEEQYTGMVFREDNHPLIFVLNRLTGGLSLLDQDSTQGFSGRCEVAKQVL